MNYYCYTISFKAQPDLDFFEIVPAWLAEAGFDSFTEEGKSIKAYVSEDLHKPKEIEKLLVWVNKRIPIVWRSELIKDRNWNREWENNFQPVMIDDRCFVRAPFHTVDTSAEFDIVIMPKMSFGTAHHETTQMMLEFILEEDWRQKEILDMGCGTGVLAILAVKMGAKSGLAIDNDIWAFENAQENIARNKVPEITCKHGNKTLIEDKKFDSIFANINRNILLQHIPFYAKALKKGGKLFLSGFLEEDINTLLNKSEEHNLHFLKKKTLNNWAAIVVGFS
ncbi:MAG TPA: 50S ribosomal protein L11 methyltransferase [Bacteroidales bacterium]|jgi:ribosomal protein L11 methyltransferase|nr:50S ribosomal protein L11 methyltransferase [Bacteroidales bacterium]MBP7873313.1 50S ribosomal protein L11 methyltransferase [Bacteroidales bacterium]MCZ2283201.1 50S ribosomal protein L11 methyltransferase [Bacteroidales bacterium]HPX33621.1 50S ribosomal protein L11 methyltransferase [Bacteroidales bacterium]